MIIYLCSTQNVSLAYKKIHKNIIVWHENEQIKNILYAFSVMFMRQLMMEKRISYFHGNSACLFVVIDSQIKEM